MLDIAYAAHASKRDNGADDDDDNAPSVTPAQRRFAVCRSVFVYFAFVDKLHALLKNGDATSYTPPSNGSIFVAQSATSPWLVQMLARVRPNNALRAQCNTLLTAYESELVCVCVCLLLCHYFSF